MRMDEVKDKVADGTDVSADDSGEMTEEEFQGFVDQLKSQGLEDEDILDILYQAFVDGDLELDDLQKTAGLMGYKLKDDFMSDVRGADGGSDGDGESGEVGKNQIEAAKEIKPGESEEDFKERVAEGEPADGGDEGSKDDEDDDERKKAMELFGD